jgi:hypothetical protein
MKLEIIEWHDANYPGRDRWVSVESLKDILSISPEDRTKEQHQELCYLLGARNYFLSMGRFKDVSIEGELSLAKSETKKKGVGLEAKK